MTMSRLASGRPAAVHLVAVSLLMLLGATAVATAAPTPTNFFNETGTLFDQADPIGDDKGPGFYQYPLDKRIRRGTFDLKRVTVYEEGPVYVFTIQTREYIMTHWPDTQKSDEQGFVVNMFDLYLDLDGRPNTGYKEALPGRELEFADRKGWEKVILVTPLSQFRAYDLLKGKTDDLTFQDMIPDIILPDYVQIQRDKIVIRISKDLIGTITPQTGFQCLALGFARVISPNRLLNMDVRGFATPTDFGGGWDTYGDPPVMDLLMPEGQDQYETLRAYRSQPSRYDIVRAKIPFLYPNQKATPAIPEVPIRTAATPAPSAAPPAPARPVAPPRAPTVSREPAPRPVAIPAAPRAVTTRPSPTRPQALRLPDPPSVIGTAGEDEGDDGDESVAEAGFVPLAPARTTARPAGTAPTTGKTTAGAKPVTTGTSAKSTSGFLPLPAKKTTTTTTVATAGFIPLKSGGGSR